MNLITPITSMQEYITNNFQIEPCRLHIDVIHFTDLEEFGIHTLPFTKYERIQGN